MTRIRTGEGRVSEHRIRGGCVHATLYNFDIDWAELKDKHRRWLRARVIPILRAGGAVTIEGRADRIWRGGRRQGQEYNESVSRARAVATQQFLGRALTEDGQQHRFNVRRRTWSGEEVATRRGDAPGVRNDWYRSVVVTACPGPAPPEPGSEPEPSEDVLIRPLDRRWFKISLFDGREISDFNTRHTLRFVIWIEDAGGRRLQQALYQYDGRGVSTGAAWPLTGAFPSRSHSTFRSGAGQPFQAPRNMTVFDFSGRAQLLHGGENERPAPNPGSPTFTFMLLHMRPDLTGRWPVRALVPLGRIDGGEPYFTASDGRLRLVHRIGRGSRR